MDDTPVFARNDLIFMLNGDALQTHSETTCAGQICCIHNPSDHPLRGAPLHWRDDRYLMERLCAHGIGHPDPDDLAHKQRKLSPDVYDGYAFGIHGCDGCCYWPTRDEDDLR